MGGQGARWDGASNKRGKLISSLKSTWILSKMSTCRFLQPKNSILRSVCQLDCLKGPFSSFEALFTYNLFYRQVIFFKMSAIHFTGKGLQKNFDIFEFPKGYLSNVQSKVD